MYRERERERDTHTSYIVCIYIYIYIHTHTILTIFVVCGTRGGRCLGSRSLRTLYCSCAKDEA